MENNHIKNLSGLILAAFFISTSSVLGKYIAMPSEVIVWFRSAFAMVFLFIYCKYKSINLFIKSSKHYAPFIISAFFTAAHWITYFYALKKANVAIGILSLYTFPVMVAFLEPLFFKIKFNPIHILLGVLVLLGVYLLAPDFNIESSNMQGVLFGLLSALFYSIRILILKQYVIQYNGIMLMFYQTFIITVFLVPVLFFMDVSGFETQYPYLLLLALLATAIGHSLMVHSFQFFSVSTASIISSVQPVFGIILAFLFLNEIPTLNTFFGGSLILATVFIESLRSKTK
ncbi:threonine/homoserine efflux transporter RhtA [Tenacibaculum adriaticum]|uniref:Threonine/homoserine efflux transporter RhtA n=1 Tax=Tenacibaculum adriaticum TaxID=413713 RepID=A0A5S5DVB3_9FLAO|nr:DMT family transporter [Tenacibaculum adriaticum]TYP99867.1 threonine/homoserine efflux transporter RhtA [Tenacibaculum adriaticum]